MNIMGRSDPPYPGTNAATPRPAQRRRRLLLQGTLIALMLSACWIAPGKITCHGIGSTDCDQAVAAARGALPEQFAQTHGDVSVDRDDAPCMEPCAEFRAVVRIAVDDGDGALVVNVQRARPNAEMQVLGVQRGASS